MKKYLLGLLLFNSVNLGAMESLEKDDYVIMESKQRVVFSRDFSRKIEVNIDPRENETINLGGKNFSYPLQIYGHEIDIGTLKLSSSQTADEFIETIKKNDEIIYTNRTFLNPINTNTYILEYGTEKGVTFIRHPEIISVRFYKDTPVNIGDVVIRSPKRVKIESDSVQIGNLSFNCNKSESDFMETVLSFDEITYRAKRKI